MDLQFDRFLSLLLTEKITVKIWNLNKTNKIQIIALIDKFCQKKPNKQYTFFVLKSIWIIFRYICLLTIDIHTRLKLSYSLQFDCNEKPRTENFSLQTFQKILTRKWKQLFLKRTKKMNHHLLHLTMKFGLQMKFHYFLI